jgi:hypothetical protein
MVAIVVVVVVLVVVVVVVNFLKIKNSFSFQKSIELVFYL